MVSMSAQFKHLVIFINGNVAAAGYTAGSHSSSHHCCVGGHTASYGQDTLCRMHSLDILRGSLQTNQDHSLSLFMRFLCLLRGKVHLACRCSRRCGKCLSDHLAVLKRLRIKGGMQKLIQRFSFNTCHCLFRCNLSFIYQITGYLECCLGCTLSVSGLQEEQLSVFNGKLHILHIAVMIFQFICNLNKLCIALGQILLQLCDRLGCSDAGYHILSLGIDQILSIDALCSG